MSIETEITRLQGAKNDLATSIAAKGVTVPAATKIDGYAALVDQIQQGGGESPAVEKDINFWDWDGTLVEAWSLSELQSKTELPDQPEHRGFTNQGWNWTLAQLKTENAPMDVGAVSKTTDGKCHLYIEIPDYAPSSQLTLNFKMKGNGAVIDWGDGSAAETYTGGNVSPSHTYATRGSYVINITPGNGGNMTSFGRDSDGFITDAYAKVYLKAIELADNVTFYSYAFQDCLNLTKCNFPSNADFYNAGNLFERTHIKIAIMPPRQDFSDVGNISPSTWCHLVCLPFGILYPGKYQNGLLKRIRIPSSVVTLSQNAFNGTSMTELRTGSGVLTVGDSAIRGGYKRYIEIGENVTTLEANSIYQCSNLVKLRFKGNTPPTANAASTFNGLPSTCIISVPTGKLSAYQTATNYPDPNTYTYIEE